MPLQNHSGVTDVQLTSKQANSHGSSLNHLTWFLQEYLGWSKSRSTHLGAGQQPSSSGSTSLYQLKCLWNDDWTNWWYQKGSQKKAFAPRRWLLSPQIKENWRVGEGKQGSQAQEESKSCEQRRLSSILTLIKILTGLSWELAHFCTYKHIVELSAIKLTQEQGRVYSSNYFCPSGLPKLLPSCTKSLPYPLGTECQQELEKAMLQLCLQMKI